MVTVTLLSDEEIHRTLDYILKIGWHRFYPFDLVIHNILPTPLRFSTRIEFMQQVLHTWNQRVFNEMVAVESTLNLKEKLFEIMMLRFELFNIHKEQLHALWQENFNITLDPEILLLWLQSFDELMVHCLPSEKSITSFVQSKLFIYRYITVQKVWFNDHTLDLQQTMAALNQQIIKHLETFH